MIFFICDSVHKLIRNKALLEFLFVCFILSLEAFVQFFFFFHLHLLLIFYIYKNAARNCSNKMKSFPTSFNYYFISLLIAPLFLALMDSNSMSIHSYVSSLCGSSCVFSQLKHPIMRFHLHLILLQTLIHSHNFTS